jgi:hypothetical protein
MDFLADVALSLPRRSGQIRTVALVKNNDDHQDSLWLYLLFFCNCLGATTPTFGYFLSASSLPDFSPAAHETYEPDAVLSHTS